MSRKTTTITVEDMDSNKYVVALKKQLSWGEQQRIQESLEEGADIQVKGQDEFDASFDGSVMSKSKYLTLETVIESITVKESGEETKFTQGWMDNLTAESGDKLYQAVNEISEPSSKKN